MINGIIFLLMAMALSSCGNTPLQQGGNSFEGKVLLPRSYSPTYLEGYIADGWRKFDIHIRSLEFQPYARAYVRENTGNHTGIDARIILTQERIKTGTVRNGRIVINYGIGRGDLDLLPRPMP